MKQVKKLPRLLMNVLLFLIFFFPFYWMVITSLKTLGETVTFPPSMWPEGITMGKFSTCV